MSMSKKLNILIFYIFLLGIQLNAQSINLYTLNTGGGYNNTLEWSIGESVSIANFTNAGYILNTGVLQPLNSSIPSIIEGGPEVFGYQISIGPNPTSNLLHVKASLIAPGNLSFQLLDSKSMLVLTHDAGLIFSSYDNDFILRDFPSGVFYMRVYFKPISGITKTGIYKIIKL